MAMRVTEGDFRRVVWGNDLLATTEYFRVPTPGFPDVELTFPRYLPVDGECAIFEQCVTGMDVSAENLRKILKTEMPILEEEGAAVMFGQMATAHDHVHFTVAVEGEKIRQARDVLLEFKIPARFDDAELAAIGHKYLSVKTQKIYNAPSQAIVLLIRSVNTLKELEDLRKRVAHSFQVQEEMTEATRDDFIAHLSAVRAEFEALADAVVAQSTADVTWNLALHDRLADVEIAYNDWQIYIELPYNRRYVDLLSMILHDEKLRECWRKNRGRVVAVPGGYVCGIDELDAERPLTKVRWFAKRQNRHGIIS